jgi:hypothetical protein
MNSDPGRIRSKRFEEIGKLIRSSAMEVIDGWMKSARGEQDSASSAHRDELRNQLPMFLEQLGAELVARGTQREPQRDAVARSHGQERWEHGWQLDEVIRDYQLLRIILLDHLEVNLSRKLNLEEVKARSRRLASFWTTPLRMRLSLTCDTNSNTYPNSNIGRGGRSKMQPLGSVMLRWTVIGSERTRVSATCLDIRRTRSDSRHSSIVRGQTIEQRKATV